MQRLMLLTTAGCHLCLDARSILDELSGRFALEVTEFDIACDDAMIDRYGLSIPVLRTPEGEELAWPFDARSAGEWLAQFSPVAV